MYAANGIDYVFMDTTLIFPSHSKPGYIKNVTVVILTDIIVESTEFIQVHLSSIGPHTTIDSDKRGARVGIYDQTGELSGAFLSFIPFSTIPQKFLKLLILSCCTIIL